MSFYSNLQLSLLLLVVLGGFSIVYVNCLSQFEFLMCVNLLAIDYLPYEVF